MIRFENVSKIFPGNFVALDGINISIEKGEFVTIVGQSGAGKSTFLKLIYAEEQPTKGRVYFNEHPLDEIKKKNLPYYRRSIGTIFQDFKLLPQKTVFENVAYALEVAGDTSAEINDKVPRILDIVGINSKMELYPWQLSGGEKQKVAIARALVHFPEVIIADEPTGNLDPISTWDVAQVLLKINSLGTTVILATHNKDMVDKLNKRVIVLDKGRIIMDKQRGKYMI